MSSVDKDHNGINKTRFYDDPKYRLGIQKYMKWEKRIKRSLIITTLLIGSLLTWFILDSMTDLPSLAELENPKPDLASNVYSFDGEIIHRFFTTNRRLVRLNDMSPHIKNALLATEDRRFAEHWGFDMIRFLKAVWVDVITLSAKEGASTLTQQLSRNLYLNSNEQTLRRKIRELWTAIQIERTYTKTEILEMYLNVVYFGSGAHGIQAASQTFFKKDAKDLTPEEAATLIGVLKSPFGFSPIFRPERSLDRRNLILYNMFDAGFLSRVEYDVARATPIQTNFTAVTDMGTAPYFTEHIRQRLQVQGERNNFDLYRDGVNIYTTIDSRMQKIANEVTRNHLDSIQVYMNQSQKFENSLLDLIISETTPYTNAVKRGENPELVIKKLMKNTRFIDSLKLSKMQLQTGFVVIDPHSGHIKAWVGGRNFEDTKFDHVFQAKRQPGSSFKPIIYTVAIDNGYAPTYEILNQPIAMEDVTLKGQWWTPKNSGGDFGGLTTLRDGLRRSLNLITIRMVIDIAKPRDVVEYAKRMGITSSLKAVPSIALGSMEVSVYELTSAFGTFPNGGVNISPIGVLRVDDNHGNMILENTPNYSEAFSPETAYIMTSMMKAVVDSGTGLAIKARYRFFHTSAGKTGTTNDHSDAWFVGFTPELVAGVWVGTDDRRMSFTDMAYGQGARAALPIWAQFMRKAYESREIGLERGEFLKPKGIFELAVCSETKKAATEFCPYTYIEVFTKRSVPEQCPKHRTAESIQVKEEIDNKIGF